MKRVESSREAAAHIFRSIRFETARPASLTAAQLYHLAAHQTATSLFECGFAPLAPDRLLELARATTA